MALPLHAVDLRLVCTTSLLDILFFDISEVLVDAPVIDQITVGRVWIDSRLLEQDPEVGRRPADRTLD